MKAVEDYIKAHTITCNSKSLRYGKYCDFLTPANARCVAQIAREETIKEVCEYIKDNLYKNLYVYNGEAGFPTLQFIEDLKKHLEE